jgi:hypothetical protein
MSTAEPEPSPVVTHDVFPAEVVLPGDRVLKEARAVVTRERLYVLVRAGSRGVDVVLEAPYDPLDSTLPRVVTRGQGLTVATSEGAVLVNKGRGCGCGNPLKSHRPFATMRAGR